jgi:glycosyltransferase involved in cell wall biosynthesis
VLDTDDLEGAGGINDYLAEHGRYPKSMLSLIAWQERAIPRRVQAVTAASQALRDRAVSHGAEAGRVFAVPNGYQRLPGSPPDGPRVDALRARLSLDGGPVALLYTRFFDYDLRRCVRSLAAIRAGAPGVRFLVVGKGEFGEETAFIEMCQAAGLADRVVYAGWVEPEDLSAHLELGDVALYPFDSTPRNLAKCPGKLVELMSLGKAIVADRVGEIAEYIVDGESGLLADSEDTPGFAAAAVRLLDHPDEARRLGEGALQRVSTAFSWAKLTDRVEAAYAAAMAAG